ncbi:multidrug transporter [Microbacterium paludicola]|uniref:multidrug transporter n=1 Tax=Microbacterium paludicola TaxID=300019 RepID=UPI00119D73C9|nr:multidrug transporter [Microbacterium paludicola]
MPGQEMTPDEKRHDQLTAAPDATEADAAPRVEVTEHDGVTRIEVADGAAVRPGPGPGMPEADGVVEDDS